MLGPNFSVVDFMPVRTKCGECGKSYNVKDGMAGKKFRCKQCQHIVVVPKPKPKKPKQPEEDWLDEDYGDDDWEEALPPPPPKKARSRKPKKKKPKSPSNLGPMIARIGAGVFVVLFGLSLLGAIAKGIRVAGGLQNLLPAPVSWQDYTTPDGVITVQMPGRAKPVKIGVIAPGGQAYGVDTPRYGCVVAIESFPAELQGMSDDQIVDALLSQPLAMQGYTNLREITMAGHRGIAFERNVSGVSSVSRGIIINRKCYTFAYARRKSSFTDESERFFNSVRVNQ